MLKKVIITTSFLILPIIIPSNVFAAILSVPSQYSTIQSAIDASVDGDVINVAAGTYNEAINFNDKAISIIGADKNTTIIDGTGLNQSVVTIIWSNPIWNPNDWSWPTGTYPQQRLENFTIQNGNTTGYGGGVEILSASPELRNLILVNNSASVGGGGIDVRGSGFTTIENCNIESNQASRGGGLYVDTSNLTMVNCNFSSNTANLGSAISSNGATGTYTNVTVEDTFGTAIELESGNGVLQNVTHAPIVFNNCLIRNNVGGPTIFVRNWIDARFSGCDISGNTGSIAGAIDARFNVYLTLDRVTMTKNVATSFPSVATVLNNSDERPSNIGNITIKNSILWGNTGTYQILPPDTSLYGDYIPAEQFVSYSIVEDGYPVGTGILNSDPLFVNSLLGNYSLTANSPAIDAGDLASSLDPDGTRADMGAYPFFQVASPQEQIQDLIDLVESFNLQQGINNSLDSKLSNALNALDDLNENNDQAAINSLQSFINAVEAQRGNQITNAQADALINAAQEIINSLSS